MAGIPSVVTTTTVATSGTGTTATVQLNRAPMVAVGTKVLISGVDPVAYNGEFTVTARSNTSPYSVSFASTATGSMKRAGNFALAPTVTAQGGGVKSYTNTANTTAATTETVTLTQAGAATAIQKYYATLTLDAAINVAIGSTISVSSSMVPAGYRTTALGVTPAVTGMVTGVSDVYPYSVSYEVNSALGAQTAAGVVTVTGTQFDSGDYGTVGKTANLMAGNNQDNVMSFYQGQQDAGLEAKKNDLFIGLNPNLPFPLAILEKAAQMLMRSGYDLVIGVVTTAAQAAVAVGQIVGAVVGWISEAIDEVGKIVGDIGQAIADGVGNTFQNFLDFLNHAFGKDNVAGVGVATGTNVNSLADSVHNLTDKAFTAVGSTETLTSFWNEPRQIPVWVGAQTDDVSYPHYLINASANTIFGTGATTTQDRVIVIPVVASQDRTYDVIKFGVTAMTATRLQVALYDVEETTGAATKVVDLGNVISETYLVKIANKALVNGGSFRLAYGAQITAAIIWNATPATLAASIQSALTALTNIGAGKATVTVNATETIGSTVGFDVLIDGPVGPISALTLSSNSLTVPTWNASTNSPTLANGTGTSGQTYRVTTAGTALGITFAVGDYITYTGTVWQKSLSLNDGNSLPVTTATITKASRIDIATTTIQTLVLPTPIDVQKGEVYYIAILANGGTINLSYSSTISGTSLVNYGRYPRFLASFNTLGIFPALEMNMPNAQFSSDGTFRPFWGAVGVFAPNVIPAKLALSDSFDRTNATNLGSNWSRQYSQTGTTGLKIVSNTARSDSTTGSTLSMLVQRMNWLDQRVSATITREGYYSRVGMILILRGNGSGKFMYLRVTQNLDFSVNAMYTTAQIFSATSYAQVGTNFLGGTARSTVYSVSPAGINHGPTTQTWKFEAIGNAYYAYLNNTIVRTWTDDGGGFPYTTPATYDTHKQVGVGGLYVPRNQDGNDWLNGQTNGVSIINNFSATDL